MTSPPPPSPPSPALRRPAILRSSTLEPPSSSSYHHLRSHHRRRSRRSKPTSLSLTPSTLPFAFSSAPERLDVLQGPRVLPLTAPTVLHLGGSSFILSYPSFFSSFLFRLSLSTCTVSMLHFASHYYFRLQQRPMLVLLQLLYHKAVHAHARAHRRQSVLSARSPACPVSRAAYPFPHFYADFTHYAQAVVDAYCRHSAHTSLYLHANRPPSAHPVPADDLAAVLEHVGRVDARRWKRAMRDSVQPWLEKRMEVAECPVPLFRGNGAVVEEEGKDGRDDDADGRRTGAELWLVLKEKLRKDMLVKTLGVQRQFAMLWEKHKILRRRSEDAHSDASESAGEDDEAEEDVWDDGEEEEEDEGEDAADAEERTQAARALLERTTAMAEQRQHDQHADTTDSETSSPSSWSASTDLDVQGRERLVRQCVGACPLTPSPSPSPLSPPMSPTSTSSLPLPSSSEHAHAAQGTGLLSGHRYVVEPLLHRSESASHFARKHSSSSASSPSLHPPSSSPAGHLHPHRRRRNPIVVFLGGGMSAGKSTVLSHLRSLRTGLFGVHGDAVYIESDHFKATDPVYAGLREDDPDRAVYVHGYSVKVAEEALLSAVRARRDIVIDGTCAWKEYVVQTARMIRRSEEVAWKRGDGVRPDGTEEYWVEDRGAPLPWAVMAGQERDGASGSLSASSSVSAELRQSDLLEQFPALAYSTTAITHAAAGSPALTPPHAHLVHSVSTTSLLPPPPPYLIAMLGVTTPVHAATSRAIRRAVITGRTVPLAALKRSYQLFSGAFDSYVHLVDAYMLYENSVDEMMVLPPELLSAGPADERKDPLQSAAASPKDTTAAPTSASSSSVFPHPVLVASKQFDSNEGVVHNPELYRRFLAQATPDAEPSPTDTLKPPPQQQHGRARTNGCESMSEKLQLLLRQVGADDDVVSDGDEGDDE